MNDTLHRAWERRIYGQSFRAGMVAIVASVVCFAAASVRAEEGWQAGLARVEITPKVPMWMSGYSSRTKPADGKLTGLFAKSLALRDPEGNLAIVITLDLIGIDRETSQQVCSAIGKAHAIPRDRIALCCSHTHSGPPVGTNLLGMFFFDSTQEKLVRDYTELLKSDLAAVAAAAVKDLAPCELAWANGRSTLAVNRRENKEPIVPELRAKGQLKGPVDYEVPVLSIRSPEGTLRGVLFGYACHATVLSLQQWCGDWPGYAQIELEKLHPGATAMFFAGCGGDQNPLPRRTVELAQAHGREIARSVESVLAGVMRPIRGQLQAKYRELDLEFDTLPSREQIERDAAGKDKYAAKRAEYLLKQMEGGKPLSPTYPYPVQAWRIGNDLTWVTLGGEVVVEYSLRLKRELGRDTWVAGYANDVMAYIPSRRVLTEGGYEGGGSMVYYGLPTRWGPMVEETIVDSVRGLAKQLDR